MKEKITIKNKKARFEYEILDKYNAGIVLSGTEIKSIRLGKASITESFCEFNESVELFVVNMNIETYSFSANFNHFPKSTRKLLLNKKELNKVLGSVRKDGFSVIPISIYFNDKGFSDELLGSNLPANVVESFVESDDFSVYQTVGSDPQSADDDLSILISLNEFEINSFFEKTL